MNTLDNILRNGSKFRICLKTLGCRVNQAEIDALGRLLIERGHELVECSEAPDISIINTCSVTSRSDSESRRLIRKAARTGSKVIVTGCYSELNAQSVVGMEGVAEIIRNKDKTLIINNIMKDSPKTSLKCGGARSRFFLKVQDGCNSSCTYCVISGARGPSKSLSPKDVLKEVRSAGDGGYKEVVLTGVNLGLYGKDLTPKTGLNVLLEEILKNTPIERLRLSSIEMENIDEGFIGLFSEKRLSRHLHIPLQSGDDGILRKMERSYNAGFFKEKILEIADKIPSLGLGTDVIAGFPGEGEREFENTVGLCEELPFTYLHVFPFSSRPGTASIGFDGKVSENIIKERCKVLRDISEKKRALFMDSHKDTVCEVLVEDVQRGGGYKGTTGDFLKTVFDSEEDLRGKIAPVRVRGHNGKNLLGSAIKERITDCF